MYKVDFAAGDASVSVWCKRTEMFNCTLVFCSLKSLSASRSRSSPHFSFCISSICDSSCVTLLCRVSIRAVRSSRSDDSSSCWERSTQNNQSYWNQKHNSSQPFFLCHCIRHKWINHVPNAFLRANYFSLTFLLNDFQSCTVFWWCLVMYEVEEPHV